MSEINCSCGEPLYAEHASQVVQNDGPDIAIIFVCPKCNLPVPKVYSDPDEILDMAATVKDRVKFGAITQEEAEEFEAALREFGASTLRDEMN